MNSPETFRQIMAKINESKGKAKLLEKLTAEGIFAPKPNGKAKAKDWHGRPLPLY